MRKIRTLAGIFVIAIVVLLTGGCNISGGPPPVTYPLVFNPTTAAAYFSGAGSYIVEGQNITVSVKSTVSCYKSGYDDDMNMLSRDLAVTVIHDGTSVPVKQGQPFTIAQGNGSWIVIGDSKVINHPQTSTYCSADPTFTVLLPNGGKFSQLAAF